MENVFMEELLIETNNGIRVLTLNRPERLNALNNKLSTQLHLAITEASAEDEVRVIVITGKGRGFCSGLDLSDDPPNLAAKNSRYKRLDELGWVGRQALGIVQCDKPVIAALNGTAAGAGLALALACDLRIMSDKAMVTTGYIQRGLSPDAGMTYFLPRLIGHTRAAEMILTGRKILAPEAERIGLVNSVLPDEEFHEGVMEFAKGIAEGPPIALTLSKRLLTDSSGADLTSTLKKELAFIQMCFKSEDVKEGVRAFAEKRKPVFKGE